MEARRKMQRNCFENVIKTKHKGRAISGENAKWQAHLRGLDFERNEAFACGSRSNRKPEDKAA